MNKKEIVLIGGGGHCKSVIDVIEATNLYHIAGIIDIKENVGKKIFGYKIIGSDVDIESFIQNGFCFHVTIGHINTNKMRKQLYEKIIHLHGKCPVIISPTAYVSKYATIGNGTIVMHFALVNANVKIGVNTILNTKSLVEHDAIIGNHCHISTGSIVNGGVSIGDNTFFGSGAVSKQNIVVPENSFIKANSIVKK